ncbi:cupin domain-containing protein [Flavobacterium sp. MEB061]|uniref:cupin domain-containing protein n=1 Tax=Flavobacterium sp. MEB061 TaxID=1587524 RepID=UPI00069888CC|nr:cupin domain-containing protein [Flavobacterium sp. MEB061]
MNNPQLPFITNDENPAAYWMLDILWVIKAHASQTDNNLSVIEQTMPFNSGPPPHYHSDMDEMFYIIDGEMTIWIEGKIHKLTAGSFAMVPRETVHYFKITSQIPCKALNMYTPGGFEKGIIRNAQETKILTLPPKGLPYKGSTDKNDMHVAVDIAPVDLIALSQNL